MDDPIVVVVGGGGCNDFCADVILVNVATTANTTANIVVGRFRCRHCTRPRVFSIISQRPRNVVVSVLFRLRASYRLTIDH